MVASQQQHHQQESAEAFPTKHTFIHFDEPSTPAAAPPTSTAPGTLMDRSFRTREPIVPQEEAEQEPELPQKARRRDIFRWMFGSSLRQSAEDPVATQAAEAGMSPVKVQLKNTFVHLEEPRTPAGPPVHSAPEKAVFLVPPPPAACGVVCQRAGMASLGSEGHCQGRCIPCLMQVRWQAGKCAEPCKFGSQCGRCHEAHTEEEVKKIQARMRKEKKQHGGQAAALLSAAYANGKVAPVGAGAAGARRGWAAQLATSS